MLTVLWEGEAANPLQRGDVLRGVRQIRQGDVLWGYQIQLCDVLWRNNRLGYPLDWGSPERRAEPVPFVPLSIFWYVTHDPVTVPELKTSGFANHGILKMARKTAYACTETEFTAPGNSSRTTAPSMHRPALQTPSTTGGKPSSQTELVPDSVRTARPHRVHMPMAYDDSAP